jgi:hypothetical protein
VSGLAGGSAFTVSVGGVGGMDGAPASPLRRQRSLKPLGATPTDSGAGHVHVQPASQFTSSHPQPPASHAPLQSTASAAAAPVAAPVVAVAAPRSALSSGRALTLLELSALSVDDDLDDY